VESAAPEIVEDFDREVLGASQECAEVTWTLRNGERDVGSALWSGSSWWPAWTILSYPAIDVNIQMTLVTPADATGRCL